MKTTHVIILFGLVSECMCQIFQYFLVNSNEGTTKVIDTVKLPTCTHIDQRDNVTLRGGVKAGKFTKHGIVKNLDKCIDICCQDETCDMAFMPGHTCYTVKCYSEKTCESIPADPSSASVGGIRISHIIRNGGKGDDVDEFRRKNGVNRNTKPNGDSCLFSRVMYGHTIVGGSHAGEIIDLGNLVDIRDCAEKCCQHDNCEVAMVKGGKCFAIDCFTKGLCDSVEDPMTKRNVLVYMNKRNGKRTPHRKLCNRPCVSGICTNDDTCLCDVGFKGVTCNLNETKGACDPPCGEHGHCNTNDTCLCEDGWEGHKCVKKIVCATPCKNGFCTNRERNECKCDMGWEGQFCNETNGDKMVLASSGEEVLFTESEMEPELDIKIPESPPIRGSESISTLAIALCCGIASAVLGAIVLIFIAKKILGKRAMSNYEYLNNIPADKAEKQKSEAAK